MHYAFDLDGTLARTREAVLLAYRMAGVEPPPDFFGKPWKAWLSDEDAHRRKNLFYEQLAPAMIHPTNIVDIYRRTGGAIITGASASAVRTVLRAIGLIPLPPAAEVHMELDMAGKAYVLNEKADTGIVFEDSPEIATYLMENTQWQVCLVLSRTVDTP